MSVVGFREDGCLVEITGDFFLLGQILEDIEHWTTCLEKADVDYWTAIERGEEAPRSKHTFSFCNKDTSKSSTVEWVTSKCHYKEVLEGSKKAGRTWMSVEDWMKDVS